jgi:PhnB protein
MPENKATKPIATTIVPWLSVRKSAQAVDFYKSALGATEVFRMDGDGDSVVARLSVEGAEFWVGDESPEHLNFSPESLGGCRLRPRREGRCEAGLSRR